MKNAPKRKFLTCTTNKNCSFAPFCNSKKAIVPYWNNGKKRQRRSFAEIDRLAACCSLSFVFSRWTTRMLFSIILNIVRDTRAHQLIHYPRRCTRERMPFLVVGQQRFSLFPNNSPRSKWLVECSNFRLFHQRIRNDAQYTCPTTTDVRSSVVASMFGEFTLFFLQ